MKRAFVIIGTGICLIGIIFCYLIVTRQMTVPVLYRYKAGNRYTIATAVTDNPFRIDTALMNILPWDSFPQHPRCCFMADPFIVRDSNDYYIFYEEMPPQMNSTWGDIAVLHSTDLEHWTRIGVAIDEPFHLSFPNVFQYEGEWYLIPEAGATNEVRLYKSIHFPMEWKYVKSLVKDVHPADPIIIEWNNVWYLMYWSNEVLRLYYADNLLTDWNEHADSPIRLKDKYQETRPAGNFAMYNDSLYYFVQRHDGGYGTAVCAYRIDTLSPTIFRETRMQNNPIVERHGNTWAKDGMHQLSYIYVPESKTYFCVMDGNHRNETKWGWDWRNWPKFRIKKR